MKFIFFANTDWYLYNFRKNLALNLSSSGHDVLLLSPPGPFTNKLQALGLRWMPVPMQRRSLNPLRELSLIFWLSQLMRQENIDLIHGFTIKCAIYGSLAGRLAGVPAKVSGIDGLGYVFSSVELRARLLRPFVCALLKLALFGSNNRLILQNSDDIAVFKKLALIDDARIRLIRGAGVDCQRFYVGGKRNDEQPLRVLLAARLLWDKGLAEYVAASKLLKIQGYKVQFLLAGTPDLGNPDSVPEKTIQAWVDAGLIVWLGHVDDMAALMATVHVLVLPSTYREGLPTCLIEGAACSLPLVTTDRPGCREVVTNEVDGLLIPVHDADALAQAIIRLNDDPELAQRLGKAARAKALEHFDESIVIKKTIDVYHEILP